MKTFATLTAAGVAGLILLKLLAAVVIPALGLLMGLVALTVKLALVAALGFFVYSMFKKASNKAAV
ncbi:MAG: hypothetical protein U5R14_13760 [Gemmatimonadota bacterium]|nr:hypothetical protein [Gemmatimonadota bacterium]